MVKIFQFLRLTANFLFSFYGLVVNTFETLAQAFAQHILALLQLFKITES